MTAIAQRTITILGCLAAVLLIVLTIALLTGSATVVVHVGKSQSRATTHNDIGGFSGGDFPSGGFAGGP